MSAPPVIPSYVPDGDPCPKPDHEGAPTILFWIAGLGLISQCEHCVDDFFAWWRENQQAKAEPLPPQRRGPPPAQLDLLS